MSVALYQEAFTCLDELLFGEFSQDIQDYIIPPAINKTEKHQIDLRQEGSVDLGRLISDGNITRQTPKHFRQHNEHFKSWVKETGDCADEKCRPKVQYVSLNEETPAQCDKDKLLQCNQCGKLFQEERALNKHFRVHIRKHPCNWCDKSFVSKHSLIKHFRTHTGEKPFHCNQCFRSFSAKGSLSEHLRTHSVEKPFKCDLCDCAYKAKRNLLRHKLSHKSKKPFQCGLCGKMFTGQYSWKKHLKSHL